VSTNLRFSSVELRDLAVAWLALALAFTFFGIAATAGVSIVNDGPAVFTSGFFAQAFLVSLLTAGVGFLLHELAHKLVAIRFGQFAEFRADYPMLALAVGAGIAGFIFAAPGAVYHGGRPITERQSGLIALAGPLTNLAIAAVAAPLLLFGGVLGTIGQVGLWINLLLAGFNMLPFGPLDGRKVLNWSKPVFAVSATVCIGLGLVAFLFLGPGFRF
jgi:Zn-dependent protease